MAGGARMVDIATPISFGGFSSATLDAFAPQLRALGLEPRTMLADGLGTASRSASASASRKTLTASGTTLIELRGLPPSVRDDYLTPWSAARAEKRFLARFNTLQG